MDHFPQPVTNFVVFDTVVPEIDLLCEAKWWNWNEIQKTHLVRRVRGSDLVGMALAKEGLWIRTVPVTRADKSPFVFFVELRVKAVDDNRQNG